MSLPNVPSKDNHWWMNDTSLVADKKEGFQEPLLPEHNPLLDFIPDGPSPTDLYNQQPYLLLEDVMPAATVKNEAVTAKNCYEADASNSFSLLGSYRQFTNNYKHEYPDNCSALNKEVEMGFYSASASGSASAPASASNRVN